jgi:hypothetical protein
VTTQTRAPNQRTISKDARMVSSYPATSMMFPEVGIAHLLPALFTSASLADFYSNKK